MTTPYRFPYPPPEVEEAMIEAGIGLDGFEWSELPLFVAEPGEKGYDPNQPRDDHGRWTRRPGGPEIDWELPIEATIEGVTITPVDRSAEREVPQKVEWADNLVDVSQRLVPDEATTPLLRGTTDRIGDLHRIPAGRLVMVQEYDQSRAYSFEQRTMRGAQAAFMGGSTPRKILVNPLLPRRYDEAGPKEKEAILRHVLTHEIGHFIDLDLLGDGNNDRWASVVGANTTRAVRPVDNVMEKIGESRTVKEMRKARVDLVRKASGADDRGFPDEESYRKGKWVESLIGYELDKRELFARAYAQWVATRTYDHPVLDDLEQRTGEDGFWYAWRADEFEPIAEAFDEMFRELRWQK